MLSTIVVHPSTFLPPENSDENFFIIAIRLLLDILQGGSLLIDYEGKIFSEIVKNIREWPDEFFSDLGNKIIDDIRKNQRVIKSEPEKSLVKHCPSLVCNSCIDVINSNNPKSVVVQGSCINCLQEYSFDGYSKSNIAEIGSFLLSYWNNPRGFTVFKGHSSKFDGLGQEEQLITRQELEREILIPVFEHAEIIKIIDRQIGRLSTRNDSPSKNRSNLKPFRENIEWMLRLCSNGINCQKLEIFEVYCGIQLNTRDFNALDQLSEAQIQKVQKGIVELEKFEREMQSIFSGFRLHIKQEDHLNDLPHDRYIITNQVGLFVGRGFDLFRRGESSQGKEFRPDDELRNTEIGYCSDPYKIERFLQDWPDVKSLLNRII